MAIIPQKYFSRKEEIFQNYLQLLDRHIDDVLNGRTQVMYELRDFAGELFIHPTHFSNVIKAHTGKHACYFFEEKLLKVAKQLLQDPNNSIADVAMRLTYDASNFTKWFKFFEHMTPSQYRKSLQQPVTNTVTVTI